MRLWSAIFLVLLTGICAHAQTDSVYAWNKWCAKRDTLLLFNSGNNTIQVYCSGMKPSDFKLHSLDRSLRIGSPEIHGDTMSVLAMPYPDKDRQMRLAVQDAKTSKTIKVLDFVSDDIPQPVARIGNLQGAEVAKSVLLMQTKLRVEFPGSLYSYPYTVTGYTFKDSTDKGPSTLHARTFFLVTNVMRLISEAPDGTELIFTDIKALCPECSTRKLPDLKFRLKKE